MRKIKKAASSAPGVMGGGIAALLAGAGINTLLLDIVPFDLKEEEKNDPKARNRIVKAGLDAVLASNPALLMQRKDVDRISIGNLDDDFDRLSECDWIIEVVVEKLKSNRIFSNGSNRCGKKGRSFPRTRPESPWKRCPQAWEVSSDSIF